MRVIDEPELPREITRDIADHETMIVWNCDVHAEMFQDWWNTVAPYRFTPNFYQPHEARDEFLACCAALNIPLNESEKV